MIVTSGAGGCLRENSIRVEGTPANRTLTSCGFCPQCNSGDFEFNLGVANLILVSTKLCRGLLKCQYEIGNPVNDRGNRRCFDDVQRRQHLLPLIAARRGLGDLADEYAQMGFVRQLRWMIQFRQHGMLRARESKLVPGLFDALDERFKRSGHVQLWRNRKIRQRALLIIRPGDIGGDAGYGIGQKFERMDVIELGRRDHECHGRDSGPSFRLSNLSGLCFVNNVFERFRGNQ